MLKDISKYLTPYPLPLTPYPLPLTITLVQLSFLCQILVQWKFRRFVVFRLFFMHFHYISCISMIFGFRNTLNDLPILMSAWYFAVISRTSPQILPSTFALSLCRRPPAKCRVYFWCECGNPLSIVFSKEPVDFLWSINKQNRYLTALEAWTMYLGRSQELFDNVSRQVTRIILDNVSRQVTRIIWQCI